MQIFLNRNRGREEHEEFNAEISFFVSGEKKEGLNILLPDDGASDFAVLRHVDRREYQLNLIEL